MISVCPACPRPTQARLDWENVRSLIEDRPVLCSRRSPSRRGSTPRSLSPYARAVVRPSSRDYAATIAGSGPSNGKRRSTRTCCRVAPQLRWHVETDGWNLLGFEHILGRRVDCSPGSPDLPKVVHVMRRLGEIPCPALPMKQAEQRWSSYTGTPELFAGERLLHTEWSPGNVVVNDVAHLVDWAWPTRGAAWIDPARWVVWLVASGHSPQSAEDCAAQVPAWHAAPGVLWTRSRGRRPACGTGSPKTAQSRGRNAWRPRPGSG